MATVNKTYIGPGTVHVVCAGTDVGWASNGETIAVLDTLAASVVWPTSLWDDSSTHGATVPAVCVAIS